MKVFRFGREMAVTFPKWCDTGLEQFDQQRHQLTEKGIVWSLEKVRALPHYDHIEMTGQKVSGIISYGADEKGKLKMNRHMIFPTLRMIPNDTRGNLTHNFDEKLYNHILVDDQLVEEYLEEVRIEKTLVLKSKTHEGLEVIRELVPSMTEKVFIEKLTVRNTSGTKRTIEVISKNLIEYTKNDESVDGPYCLKVRLDRDIKVEMSENEQVCAYFITSANKPDELIDIDPEKHFEGRLDFIQKMDDSMIIMTPDEEINMACQFNKRRFSESIIKTKRGYMHAPGGGDYYAALWTNDQCEYVNPIFPYLGYKVGIDQSINAYSLFMTYMNDFDKPLVSSIVAEGDSYWAGAGDRGDAAMFAYGASRFALALGDRAVAEELYKGIKWSIDYSLNKKNEAGVIMSDSDELENRFESGNANLFTSCLVYDALKSIYFLGQELDLDVDGYMKEAIELEKNIETYFGKNIQGYETYEYCKDHNVLRSWICMPLVMGIERRVNDTISALISKALWTKDGLKTHEHHDTFWDRSTLFALRGMFVVGKTDIGLDYLKAYTKRRLLGEHVPYPVEAYPEGNQRHLSAESALYIRVLLEGMIGLRPIGFNKFILEPNLPETWPFIEVNHIYLGGEQYDIRIEKKETYQVTLVKDTITIKNQTFTDSIIIDLGL